MDTRLESAGHSYASASASETGPFAVSELLSRIRDISDATCDVPDGRDYAHMARCIAGSIDLHYLTATAPHRAAYLRSLAVLLAEVADEVVVTAEVRHG